MADRLVLVQEETLLRGCGTPVQGPNRKATPMIIDSVKEDNSTKRYKLRSKNRSCSNLSSSIEQLEPPTVQTGPSRGLASSTASTDSTHQAVKKKRRPKKPDAVRIPLREGGQGIENQAGSAAKVAEEGEFREAKAWKELQSFLPTVQQPKGRCARLHGHLTRRDCTKECILAKLKKCATWAKKKDAQTKALVEQMVHSTFMISEGAVLTELRHVYDKLRQRPEQLNVTQSRNEHMLRKHCKAPGVALPTAHIPLHACYETARDRSSKLYAPTVFSRENLADFYDEFDKLCSRVSGHDLQLLQASLFREHYCPSYGEYSGLDPSDMEDLEYDINEFCAQLDHGRRWSTIRKALGKHALVMLLPTFVEDSWVYSLTEEQFRDWLVLLVIYRRVPDAFAEQVRSLLNYGQVGWEPPRSGYRFEVCPVEDRWDISDPLELLEPLDQESF